ncbi:MAG: serine hydrolase [Firmicutes bacterium]|nr:serine hydrolase [Bacillota bacterium]
MKKHLLFVIALFFLFGSNAYAESVFNEAQYKKYLKEELYKWQVPGCAVLIIRDNQVIFKDGCGMRDIKKRLPVTSKTIFPIGSCSKAFTAFSIGILVDQKKMDLDKPAKNYYPQLRLNNKYITENVTPRDLLCHRTGIPGYDLLWYGSKLTRYQLMDRLRYLRPNKGFRDMFQYNNLTYVLAGVLVEKVSGKSWETFIKENIFVPLDMNMTNTDINESIKSDNYSKPYCHGSPIMNDSRDKAYNCAPEEIPFHDISAVGPAGSINSNIEDMEKWVRLYISNGKAGEKQLISPESLEQLMYPQIPGGRHFSGRMDIMSPPSYCLGWGSMTYRGNYVINHAGSIDGFTSMICIAPGKKTAVVVLTNTFKSSFASIIAYDALDRALGCEPEKWSDIFREAQLNGVRATENATQQISDKRMKNTGPSLPLKKYAGRYKHPAFGECIITENKGILHINFSGIDSDLEHWQKDTFAIKGIEMAEGGIMMFGFVPNKSGAVASITIPLEAGTDPVVFEKEVK